MRFNRMNPARALLCAFALVTVSVPMGGEAGATHAERTLNLTPENKNDPVGGRHNVTATLSASPDVGSVTIHFEIDGAGDPGPNGPGSGTVGSVNTPDGNSPETPDRTCVVVVGATECSIFYRSPVEGPDEIRGWIDHDETIEADMNEGPDENLEPGDVPEKDNTDVVKARWFVDLPPGANLTCAADQTSQPQNAKNTATCTLQNSTGTKFAGWIIDAENLGGANDPDDSYEFGGLADYDNACTTAANGKCTVDLPTLGEAGTATVCFWVDEDADPSFHMTPKQDGAFCDDPEPAPGADQGNHNTTAFADVTWFAVLDQSARLECSPDAASVPSSGPQRNHSVRCSLTNEEGPVEGIRIDAENLNGANDPDSSAASGTPDYNDFCTTDSEGKCDAQITIPNPGVEGLAEICFWADENEDDGFDQAGERWDGGDCDRDPDRGDSSDVVHLEWALAERSVTLTTSRPVAVAGKSITLSGRVASAVSDCIDGVEVNLQRAIGNAGDFEMVGPPVFTDETGNYSIELSSKVSASYRAVLPRTDCAEAISSNARVDVRKKLMLKSGRDLVRRGRVVRLRAKVLSCTDGATDRVVLYKRVGGVFKKRAGKSTNENCVTYFKRKINQRSVFKAFSPRDADQLANYSSRVVVRLK